MLIIKDNHVELTNKYGRYIGKIERDNEGFYLYVSNGKENNCLFLDANIDKLLLQQTILGYNDRGDGVWPYCRTKEDVIKLLKYFNTLQNFNKHFINLIEIL